MVITMNDSKLSSIVEVKRFLQESEVIEFKRRSRKEAYEWIEETLKRFDYLNLSKKEKGLIKKYLQKVTGYSRPQVTRKIREYRETGRARLKEYERNKFKRKYSNKDIQLLALDRRITRLSQWGGPKADLRAHGQYLWGRPKEGLSAVDLLCKCNGYALFEQIWFTEFAFQGEKKWTKKGLLKQLDLLQEKQVITIKGGIINFAGDDFDRVYAKYFARKQGISLSINEIPLELSLIIRLHSFLRSRVKGIKPFPFFNVSDIRDLKIQEAAVMMKEDDEERNPFKVMPDEAQL